jgi:hypothetical protein
MKFEEAVFKMNFLNGYKIVSKEHTGNLKAKWILKEPYLIGWLYPAEQDSCLIGK